MLQALVTLLPKHQHIRFLPALLKLHVAGTRDNLCVMTRAACGDNCRLERYRHASLLVFKGNLRVSPATILDSAFSVCPMTSRSILWQYPVARRGRASFISNAILCPHRSAFRTCRGHGATDIVTVEMACFRVWWSWIPIEREPTLSTIMLAVGFVIINQSSFAAILTRCASQLSICCELGDRSLAFVEALERCMSETGRIFRDVSGI